MEILDRVRSETGRRMDYGFVDAAHARAQFPQRVLGTDATRRGYLRDLASASMSLVTHGVKDCFSWRMGEHLALRRFALFERPVNETRVPLVEGKNAAFFESDLSHLATSSASISIGPRRGNGSPWQGASSSIRHASPKSWRRRSSTLSGGPTRIRYRLSATFRLPGRTRLLFNCEIDSTDSSVLERVK